MEGRAGGAPEAGSGGLLKASAEVPQRDSRQKWGHQRDSALSSRDTNLPLGLLVPLTLQKPPGHPCRIPARKSAPRLKPSRQTLGARLGQPRKEKRLRRRQLSRAWLSRGDRVEAGRHAEGWGASSRVWTLHQGLRKPRDGSRSFHTRLLLSLLPSSQTPHKERPSNSLFCLFPGRQVPRAGWSSPRSQTHLATTVSHLPCCLSQPSRPLNPTSCMSCHTRRMSSEGHQQAPYILTLCPDRSPPPLSALRSPLHSRSGAALLRPTRPDRWGQEVAR